MKPDVARTSEKMWKGPMRWGRLLSFCHIGQWKRLKQQGQT